MGDTLRKCQRYYYEIIDTVFSNTYGSLHSMGRVWFPTTMRATPTVDSTIARAASATLTNEYINLHYYGWYVIDDTTTNCQNMKASAEL